MPTRHHIIIDAWNCKNEQIRDPYEINGFLNKIKEYISGKTLEGPLILKRKERPGFTGTIITEESQVNIHTFNTTDEIAIDIYSTSRYDKEKIIFFIIRYFSLSRNSLKIIDLDEMKEELIECEEPRCTRPATKVWKGRNVCAYHYEQYQEEYNRMRQEHNRYM
jgi:S-adenosylmethionine/arginine decarboxylase-like enzyme